MPTDILKSVNSDMDAVEMERKLKVRKKYWVCIIPFDQSVYVCVHTSVGLFIFTCGFYSPFPPPMHSWHSSLLTLLFDLWYCSALVIGVPQEFLCPLSGHGGEG